VGDTAALTLVAIADTLRDGLDELVARSLAAVENGATAIHLRLKGEDARTLLDACRALIAALPVPVLVHDRTDVAVAARAAGVHLSPEEIPAAALRGISPPGFLIGASVATADDLALAAGADYISVGPVFGRGARATEAACLGVEGFADLARLAKVPVIAVGGVTAANVRSVLTAGAVGVAVITGAYAKAEAARTIRDLRAAIGT
jgi:thiamine-phosphate diphosphorylase